MNKIELKNCTTLEDLLRFRAKITPDKQAYAYLKNGLDEDVCLTYWQLDQAARAVAASLADRVTPGDRSLILYPPGVDFLIGFFGSIYAGLVPIPVPPPDPSRLKRTLPRLMSIVRDANATIVLTIQAISDQMAGSDFDSLHRMGTDNVQLDQADLWKSIQGDFPDPDTLAYLQYTSGSTGDPKGVMLTHSNVLYDLSIIQQAFGYNPDSISVVWLPNFHDYGLVDGLLEPLYNGTPCYIISPITFIKYPILWLKAIDRYRATHTQAPNFAYQRCIEKSTPEHLTDLDLSSMRVASNGAEPVRRETVLGFISTFVPCGFSPDALYPAYGMAEATLIITLKGHETPIKMCHVDGIALEYESRIVEVDQAESPPGMNTRWIVSCGQPTPGKNVVISHMETQTRCNECQVGEIWLSDPSVAIGYWKRPKETLETFGGRLTDAPDEGPFLRTGDLGFMKDGEVYFTGRLKDLVIIDGVNHYPQDIEWTVEKCHPAIRPGQCVVFSMDIESGEQLVVMAELNQPLEDWEPLFSAVRRSVAESHELTVHAFSDIDR